MAIQWQKKCDGVTYQVRTHGASVRLYSNGTFHSQWNPQRVLGGAIWDLLVLPGFLLQPSKPLRVLVLGVGGGTVVRQALALLPVAAVKAVDLDAIHLDIATRWFGLGADSRVELVCADATQWVREYRGPAFDLVIDDLFGHSSDEVERSVAFTGQWAKQLLSIMTSDSVLIVNNESTSKAAVAAETILSRLAKSGRAGQTEVHGVCMRHWSYENGICAVVQGAGVLAERRWRQGWTEKLKATDLNASQVVLASRYIARATRCLPLT